MIPTEQQAKALWDKYDLPEKKRIHVQLVADVAIFLAKRLLNIVYPKLSRGKPRITIQTNLLLAGALLHDLDKNIPRLPGERHPETAVRILKNEEMEEIANLIKFHSVQFIENSETAPKTWEEKLLFLSDKMVKQEIITVDKRFALWLAEDDLPEEQKAMLRRIFPLVKNLEGEIFTMIGLKSQQVANLLKKT